MKLMRTAINKIKMLLGVAAALSVFASCNKQFEDIGPDINPSFTNTGATLNDVINNDTTYSFFKAVYSKASTGAPTASLSNPALRFTAFLPNNTAFRASGITSATNAAGLFPNAAAAAAFVNYLITPQQLRYDSIPSTFPNLIAPTLLNPTAGTSGFNPLVSLSIFPSKRGTVSFVNNVPLSNVSASASNAIILNPAGLVTPPQATLWSRISTDADMTYFKAAVQRGDSGSVGTARFDSLLNLAVGPNFTVLVPTNAAFQTFLTGSITQALVARGLPATSAQAAASALVSTYGTTILTNPASIPDAPIFPSGTGIGVALATAFSPTNVKGLVVYHMFGAGAFTVNFPPTPTNVPTLLNTVVPSHPGVKLGATFNASGTAVTAATVQGVGNAAPASVLINPTPNPNGTSDQFFTNGVLHKISQVLLPQ